MRKLNGILLGLAWLCVGLVTAIAQTKPLVISPTVLPTNAPASKPATNAPPATGAAAATKPAPATAERNIRFQFDGIPYADVLERFAQMANKPLIADTKVEGTLTFNDPKPYNYQEALDTLNLMLSMKGMMLMEDGHYLRVVPFKELSQMPFPILHGVEKVTGVRPGEIVTVVLDLKNLDARDVAASITNLLSTAGSVVPLSRGRGLIVTDRLVNIQRIRSLISVVDNETVAERQMRTYTLLHSSGAVIADLLNRTFGVATAPKRTEFNPSTKRMEVLPPDPDDYITAVYDDASRTLVLFGPRERLQLADDLVSKFEDGGGGAGEVRIYTPQLLKADELATMIRQAIPGVASQGETASSAATKARVIADPEGNRLIVAAPLAGQADQIELLINQLDKPVHGSGGTSRGTKAEVVQLTKIFRTRTADATNVSQILKEALTRRLLTGLKAPTASVTVEPHSQSVIVTGSPGDIQIATDIITQLETGSTMPRPQQTRFIDLGSPAEAKRLLPLVEQIYRSQVTDSVSGVVASARLVPEPESGRLIVTASEEHQKVIEDIVQQLRLDKARPMQRRLQIVELKNARLETNFTSLNSLITERMSDKRFEDQPKPSVISDPANNRLLITATDEQFKEIEQIVAVVDIAPEQQQREMGVIPVQSKTPTELIAMVTQLMPQIGDHPGKPQLEPKLIPDASGKQIIVLASQKDIERVRALVQQLDGAATEAVARQFRGVELQGHMSAELTPLVQQLYQEQLKGQPEPAGGPATVLSDPKNNRIMISGVEREIARVEAIIRQLDPEGRKGAREETRVIRLKTAVASELSSLVEKSLSTQARQVKVLVDTRSNSLVITGETSAVEAASQMIAQLDTRSDVQPREMRIIELRSGDAASVGPMVTSLVTELLKDQRGPDFSPQTKIIPDATGNRLIVSGPKNELETVSRVVEQLDNAPAVGSSVQVFKLVNADAAKIVGVVSNTLVKFDNRNQPIRRVSVTADLDSNSIVVAGAREDLKDAEAIVQRLDNEGLDPKLAADRARQLKLIEVQSNDTDGLAALAMKVFAAQNAGRTATNLVSITPEANGKRLIVLAPPSILPQVETVISALDTKPDQGLRELHSVELKNARASDLLATVNRIYSEQTQGKTVKPASIHADANDGRLMVFGTQDQAAAVRQIVETLETKAQPSRETRVFDLGQRTEAQRLLPLVQQLYQDQYAKNPAAGPADAQIISDGRTGRVVVSARPDHLKAIEKVIADLQPGITNAPPVRETRAFDVGSAAEVQRLQPLVQQLYTEQWKTKPESDPADAQILADPKSGRLIVTGKPEHLKQIEAILGQFGAGMGKPRSDRRETRIIDLTTASAVELATTVKTLYTEQSKERFGGLPSDTLITPDVGGNRLIVVGDTNEVAVVEDIVKKLDKVSAQGATARLFKIKSADPAKVAEILTAALVRYDAYGRTQKRASVSVDTKSRTLIVTGDAKELQSVSIIIEQLDTTLGEQPARQTKVVTLKQGRAIDMAVKLRQLYNDRIKSQPDLGTSEILIMEEVSSNQLILAGSEPQLKILDEILNLLEKSASDRPERETKVFDLGRAGEVQRLLPLVQQLYTEQWKTKAAGDPADAQILAEPKTARLIVTGKPDHLKHIEGILNQFGVGLNKAHNDKRETRIIDLTTASAVELATTVKTLYTEQSKERFGGLEPDTLITPDVGGNRLIVVGSTNEVAVVEDIVKKLDKVSAQGATARLFKIKSADPAKVAEILTAALVRYDAYGRTQKRASVSVDTKSRTLIVTGDAKELQSVSIIIEQLDTTLGEQPARQTKVVTLKQGRAIDMAVKLRQLYNDRIKSQPDLGTSEILIMEEVSSNQLILAGSDPQLKILDELLDLLEKSAGSRPERETKMLEVGRVDEVQRLLPLVQQLYTDHWKSKNVGDPADAQIIADPTGRRLIVTGRPDHLKEIENILATVQGGTPKAEPRATRVYDLTNATATELATTVRSLYQEQSKNRPGAPPVGDTLILPDSSANRLIVSGETNELAVIEAIVKTLDTVSAQSASTRIIKLKSADPDAVAQIMTQALVKFDNYGRPQKRASVAVDAKTRTLVVTGDPKELQTASLIIEQLDAGGQAPERQMKVVPLPAGRVTGLATQIRSLYQDQVKGQPIGVLQEPLITEDSPSNQLILAGSEEQLKLIESILKVVRGVADVEPRDTRVFDLTTAQAAELTRTVQSLYQEQLKTRPVQPLAPVLIMPDLAANRIVISGISNELNAVEVIIKKLDTANALSAGTRVFKLTNAEPEQVGSVLSSSLVRFTTAGRSVPRVTVGVDARSRTLIVSGEPKDLNDAATIVKEFDQRATRETRQMRIFPLESGTASEVSTRVRELFDDQMRGRGQTGDAEALILGDDTANRLIVSASEAQLKVLDDILKQLKEAKEGSTRQVQVVPLKHVSAEPVAQMISQLYYRQISNRDPAQRLAVTASPDDRTLLVDGDASTLTRINQLIQTLDQAQTNKQSVIQTVQLKKAEATPLAEAVSKAISGRETREQLKRVNVTPVDGANALLLNGPGDAVEEVMKIVRELDQESVDGEIEVRIYNLKSSDAREILPVVKQLLDGVAAGSSSSRSRGRSSSRPTIRPTVAVMERSNSLIVTAAAIHFKMIEQLLPTLDQLPERSDRDVHFVWLKKAKAVDVVTTVEAVFAERRAGDRPILEADDQANSITVIARHADLVEIQDLITRLDESSRDGSLQVRLRTLDRIPAEQMARMLTNIYPQMYTGKVRVVDKLAPPLNAPVPPAQPGVQNQIPPAPGAPVPGAGTNAAPVVAEVVIGIDRDANALILSGPTEELDQIDRIITDLQYTALAGDAELHVFPLKEADPVIVARMLNDLFRPEAQPRPQPAQRGQPAPQIQAPPPPKMVVVAEPRTRSIIVRAKAIDFTLMESLIKQLDAAGVTSQLDFRLIPLTNAPAEKIAPVVQQMARQMSVVSPGDAITVTAYPRTRSLIVFARASVIDQMEKLIRSLDTQSEHAEAEVRVFALKKASALQLAAVMQNMLKVSPAGDLTPEARELQEQIRRLKVQNDKGEAVILDLTKPIKIMTDPATGQRGGNRLLISSTPDNIVALATVVEMLDQVTLTEGVDVNLVRLLHADAATVSKTLTTIFTQGHQLATGAAALSQPEGPAGKALVSPFTVAVDERLNTVILSGQKESLALAKKIIDDLDKPIERFLTEVKLFRLNHASATRMLPLLQAVFAEGAPVPGTEGASTFVTRLRTSMETGKQVTAEQPKARPALTIQADDALNVLIIAARTDALPLIEEVIKQLDIPDASGLAKLRIYPLQHADAVVIQKILTDIYRARGPNSIRNEDRPNITVDDRSNSMIVSGNDKAFAIIDSLLLQLDKKLPIEFRDIHIVPLAHADAVELAATVQKLMDARIARQGSLGKGEAESLRVLILPEERSNSLLVGGGKDSFELVESLVKQLDSAAPALGGRVRLVPLEYADARLIATSLTGLFTQRYAAARTQETRRNRPVIVADMRVNGLLISAAVDDNEIIDDLIKKLDRKLDNPALTLTVLPLQHNDAAQVAKTLENIFAARVKARSLPGQQTSPSEQVSIETDSLNNSLIISANKENLELIQELVKRVDVEPTVIGGELETFVLQHADAQRVATMLRGLVQQGLYRPGRPLVGGPAKTTQDALAISVDPRSNTLIVSASPDNLAVVKAIIAKVDTVDLAEATNIKLYRLEKSRADNVARVLTQFFEAKRRGDAAALNAPERSIPVAVIPDNRINALLVTGSKEAFDILDRILPQLDGQDMMAQLNFRVFPLKQATAMKLQSTLTRLFTNRPARVRGEPVDPITIVADAWVNALIVGAVVEDMGMVESLITRLDSDQADMGITVEVIPLLKANATKVAATVQSLYREGPGGGALAALPIVVNADERVNALIVSGGETDLKRIREVVQKLDTDQVARVSEIRVMPLKYARAEALATMLNAALNTKPPPLSEQSPNAQSVLQFITRTEDGRELVTAALKEAVLITPDPRMNSLIISGPVDYMGLLEQIIARLDNSSPREAQIKVFSMKNADAHQTGQLLMSIFRMQPTGGQSANQRTIQYTLMRPTAAGQEEAASAILGSEEQSALTVSVDPRTNSLLVGGTEHYVALVEEIIGTLDSSEAAERKTEVYRLKTAQATNVAMTVRTFLDQERLKVTQVLGADAVGTAQRMLEREVSIVADGTSNTLLLSASPRFYEQVRNLIMEIDQAQPQVLIQVLLAEVSLNAVHDLGIEWNYTKNVGGGRTVGTALNSGSLYTPVKSLSGYSALATGNDFQFLLTALQNDGRVEVLSRPQILTADNVPAFVNVGQRVPLITDSRVTVQGDTINSFRYENVGVNLQVTAHIGGDGLVKMDVGTTNSSLSTSTVEINKNATVPIINERRASTTVSVQNGQTVIIGGLISSSDDILKKKVPLLGDIPYLGVLFRSSKKTTDRRELLILLTPQILLAGNEGTQIMNLNEMTRGQLDRSDFKDGIKRDDLQKKLLDPLFPPKNDEPMPELKLQRN